MQTPKKKKVPEYGPAPPGYESPYASGGSTTTPTTYGGYTQPEEFSYDPALEAQRRAAQRALEDTTQDIEIAQHQAKQDYKVSQKDLRLSKRRGLSDIRRGKRRGMQDLRLRRKDVALDAGRARENFNTRLSNLVENYRRKGNVDRQQLNIAGQAEGGAVAASNARRLSDFLRDKAPIDTGLARVSEDEAIANRRLDITTGRLLQDTQQSKQRLKQDVKHDMFLNKRDLKRTRKELKLQLQRAIREGTFTDIDLIKQEIYQASQLHPGRYKELLNKAKAASAAAAEGGKKKKGGKKK